MKKRVGRGSPQLQSTLIYPLPVPYYLTGFFEKSYGAVGTEPYGSTHGQHRNNFPQKL
jgi:hypothetical protein